MTAMNAVLTQRRHDRERFGNKEMPLSSCLHIYEWLFAAVSVQPLVSTTTETTHMATWSGLPFYITIYTINTPLII
jgi:hypothetical protein